MGGMQESCHTCRMLEVDNVKGMCEYYTIAMPTSVDGLCRNELPKGRKGESWRRKGKGELEGRSEEGRES